MRRFYRRRAFRRGRFWRNWHQNLREEDSMYGNRPHSPRQEWRHSWHQYFSDYLGLEPEDHWLFGGRRFRPWISGSWGIPNQFNPFIAEVFSQGGGLLPMIVLHLIQEQPRYGNDIMREIEEITRGGWSANPGAVYPLLTTLQEYGFIVGEWEKPEKRSKRMYRITDDGRAELSRLVEVMAPMLEEAADILLLLANGLNNEAADESTGENEAEP
ncbi:MAG: PadR family transcriptional regulator [Anaerolineales bacterium]|nr:PadR family transcriptional regulator [Anaerolineales bacterium]